MSKEDQVVQEKVLTFKTINTSHIDQVANFIVTQYSNIEIVDQDQKAKLSWIANLMLIPVAKSQWSFGLFEDNELVGVYLQVDLVDYLNTVKLIDMKTALELFNVGQFHQYLQNLETNLKRGEFLLSIFNVTKSHRPLWAYRKQITLIHQGFYLSKLGGWKNIIFQTDNPIPFLKLSGDVLAEGQQISAQRRNYLMKINLNQLNLSVSPFQKIYAKI